MLVERPRDRRPAPSAVLSTELTEARTLQLSRRDVADDDQYLQMAALLLSLAE